jgi:hypothetical protein
MDLVGPKYLAGGFSFYILNVIDTENHYAGVYPLPDKSSKSIASALKDFWESYSMPDFLQMDNELTFRGSNRHPRSLGLVLRLALSQGITPIFIPPSEPWRNGIVEKFNHNVLKYFYSTQKFKDLQDTIAKAKEFSVYHNQNHRYSSQSSKTPNNLVGRSNQYKLTGEIDLGKPIPLTEGKIIFIRFIRSDQVLKILNTKFKVNKQLVYTYVIAEIVIEKHVLIVFQDNIIHHVFPFIMPVDW